MRIKPGVQLDGVHFMLWIAAAWYDYIRQVYGYGEGTVTGGRERADNVGPARVATTLHPGGKAVDLRSNDIPVADAAAIAQTLQEALGADFRVVPEIDHIHVEYRGTVTFA